MQIRHKDVQVGDLILRGAQGGLTMMKVIGITKSGSLKVTYGYDGDNPDGYARQLVADPAKHGHQKYLPKGYESPDSKFNWREVYWLLDRDGQGSNQ